ncbi:MAG: glycosyltransferase family 9 protein [Sedimentisphaerales bacterium]|nr:glycosyltransferase family 9 protein [Sedimentisphaerales bacterium]
MQADTRKCLGLIIHPGALGDCVLTLPLARLIRRAVGIARVDVIGHRRYWAALAGRSDIGRIMELDSLPLHRLFVDKAAFDLPEGDALIQLLRPYDFIVTFLSDAEDNFERNLIYVANMTHAAEVITLQPRAVSGACGAADEEHTAGFFMRQFVESVPELEIEIPADITHGPLLWATNMDREVGRDLLSQAGVSEAKRLLAVHPGSGGAGKCWPLDLYLDLLGELEGTELRPIVLLGPTELERWSAEDIRKIHDRAVVMSDLTIEQLLGVLSCCDVYLGNDSGVSHLAGVLGMPVVSIFGPTEEARWLAIGDKVRVCRGLGSDAWPSCQLVMQALWSIMAGL